jgi:gliding motility-associated protein GldM
MALPKEPRQKMINIMYLVLTALLALNVSAEILNAFKTVDNSLTTTNKTIATSTSTILKSLQDKADDPNDPNNAKAKIWLPIAQRIQDKSSEAYEYIQSIRTRILTEAGFKPNAGNKFDSSYKLDNLDIATRIMIEQKEGPKLKARLEQYRTDLLALLNDPAMQGLDADTRKQFENSIQLNLAPPKVQDKSNKAWEAAYFHMVPTVAAVTILSKFQNDVRTTENKAVAFCHQQVGHVVVRYDRFEPIIGQSTNYAMPGQPIEIKAGIGAFSSAAKPIITIGGQEQTTNDSGFVRYKTIAASSLGQKTIPIHIVYKNQDGNLVPLDRVITYTVGQASTAIALPEMNVLYIGYPNKVTVTAAGVGAEKISISAPGANVNKTANGEFIVSVSNQTDNLIITAIADGKTLGSSAYRVRLMPGATASVGGKKSGDNVNAATLAAQPGVGAGIENFPLPLRYEVVRFQVVGTDADGNLIRENCSGNTFTPRAKQIIKDSKSGDIITIEEIYCKGPDGAVKKLPSLLYNIN